jgi:hypothetical protein
MLKVTTMTATRAPDINAFHWLVAEKTKAYSAAAALALSSHGTRLPNRIRAIGRKKQLPTAWTAFMNSTDRITEISFSSSICDEALVRIELTLWIACSAPL